MEIRGVNPNGPNNNLPDTWPELMKLYNEAKSEYATVLDDMKNNPQKTMEDLDKLIAIGEQMVFVATKMPAGATSIHENVDKFVSLLDKFKADIVNGNPVQKDEDSIYQELGNIFFDITQGKKHS